MPTCGDSASGKIEVGAWTGFCLAAPRPLHCRIIPTGRNYLEIQFSLLKYMSSGAAGCTPLASPEALSLHRIWVPRD